MAFFNEFPHTRTYDSDLAWLIKRMKEVLSRMDSVEERMAAVENLVNNFLEVAPQIVREVLEAMLQDGSLLEFLFEAVGEPYAIIDADYTLNRYNGDSPFEPESTSPKMRLYLQSRQTVMRATLAVKQSNSQNSVLPDELFHVTNITSMTILGEQFNNLSIPFKNFVDLFEGLTASEYVLNGTETAYTTGNSTETGTSVLLSSANALLNLVPATNTDTNYGRGQIVGGKNVYKATPATFMLYGYGIGRNLTVIKNPNSTQLKTLVA